VNALRSANIDVKLGREDYDALIARLKETPVSLTIKRGRFTARGLWVQLEFQGREADVDYALKISRAAGSAA